MPSRDHNERRMKKPNFLFFITDQHRADYLGCAGHPIVKTPNIDAMAAQGTRFDQFHVATPVCMPNRASLLPKNSLGALLLDFRASIRAPADNHYGDHAALDGPARDSAADLENMLEQLTSGGDADGINQELEKVRRLPILTWPLSVQYPCDTLPSSDALMA